jgi:hypothetical protein
MVDEWIECGKSLDELRNTFPNRELTVGTLLDIDNTHYLVGDIDPSVADLCGCCEAIDHNLIVKRYMIIQLPAEDTTPGEEDGNRAAAQ